MSERAAHTAGEWKIDARPFIQHGVYHISNGQYIVATAMGQTSSCETEALKHARLIAAAPDYAAGVEQMLAYEQGGGDGWWKGWEMLKAAHAKSGAA